MYNLLPFLILFLPISPSPSLPISPSTVTIKDKRPTPIASSIAAKTIAQQITVQVKGRSNQGSGIIISRQAEGFYVLTNAHVVPQAVPYRVITADGVSHRVIRRQIIPKLDLALLLFASNKNYRVAAINNAPIAPGTAAYVAGWPRSGGSLRQPIFIGTKGKITEIDSDLPLGYSLSYSNLVRAGMSGGPILDAQGRLIGINGIVRLENTGNRVVASGIAINTYLQWQNSQSNLAVTASTIQPKLETARGSDSLDYTLERQLSAKGTVNAVVFNPTNRTIISGSSKGTINIWQPDTKEADSYEQGNNSSINAIALSPDGTILATGGDDNLIHIWDLTRMKVLKTLTGHKGAINSLIFSPDGQTLISGGWDKTIRLWELPTGKAIATLTGHVQGINSLEITPDGKTLASGSQDRTIRLWELPTRKAIATLTGHNISVLSLAISPDGKTLASGSGDGQINLWQLDSRKLTNTLQAHTDGIWSMAIASDNRTLLSSSWDKTIKVWHLDTADLQATLTGHRDYIGALTLGADARTLISADWGGQIYIWQQ